VCLHVRTSRYVRTYVRIHMHMRGWTIPAAAGRPTVDMCVHGGLAAAGPSGAAEAAEVAAGPPGWADWGVAAGLYSTTRACPGTGSLAARARPRVLLRAGGRRPGAGDPAITRWTSVIVTSQYTSSSREAIHHDNHSHGSRLGRWRRVLNATTHVQA
jgi:hypothetical protein